MELGSASLRWLGGAGRAPRGLDQRLPPAVATARARGSAVGVRDACGKPLGCTGNSYPGWRGDLLALGYVPVKGWLDEGVMVGGEAVPCVWQGRVKQTACFALSSWLALRRT